MRLFVESRRVGSTGDRGILECSDLSELLPRGDLSPRAACVCWRGPSFTPGDESLAEKAATSRRTPKLLATVLVIVALLPVALWPARAADDLAAALRQGLFEEEGNQNIPAAIEAYQALLAAHENDRKLAATAVFRLGECYRKLGRTNDAVAQYQRIATAYTEQTNLVTLSRQNLAGLGAAASSPSAGERAAGSGGGLLGRLGPDVMRAEWLSQVALYEGLTNRSRAELQRILPTVAPDELLSQLLGQELSLAARRAELAGKFSPQHPEIVALERQAELLDKQIAERVDSIREGLSVKADVARRQLAVLGSLPDSAGGPSSGTNLDQGGSSFASRLAAITKAAGGGVLGVEDLEIQRIQSLIRNSPDLINALSVGGEAPLHGAALNGRLSVMKFLLDNGAQIDLRRSSGRWTALAIACDAGHKAVAELLLDRGANPNARLHGGGTVLHSVAAKGYLSILELLLRRGADPDLKDEEGRTPLHLAVLVSQTRVVESLLGAKVNLEEKDYAGRTPLHLAVKAHDLDMSELLLKRGANIDAQDKSGWPPLGVAMNLDGAVPQLAVPTERQVRMATALLERGAGLDFVVNGQTPLHLAVALNSPELVRRIVDRKASVSLPNAMGLTPLQYAVVNSSAPEIIPLLVKAGADPSASYPPALALSTRVAGSSNSRDVTGEAPLFAAIFGKRLKQTEALLAAGARLESAKPNQYSPNALFPTVYGKDVDFVKLVLKYKPALDAHRSADGATALHAAVIDGVTNIVAALLEAGAPVDALDANGYTPLHHACERGMVGVAALLLKAGADPNRFTGAGWLPLELVRNRIPEVPVSQSLPIPGPVMPTISSFSPTPSASAPDFPELLTLLRNSGADEGKVRLGTISVFRPGRNREAVIFRRGTNEFNRHSLFEFMTTVYRKGPSSESAWQYPDFKRLTIHRLVPGQEPSERKIPVDLEAALGVDLKASKFTSQKSPAPSGAARDQSACSASDVWLEWGDRVELPETEHPISSVWPGIWSSAAAGLGDCVERSIELISNGQTNRFNLSVRRLSSGTFTYGFDADSFRLHQVLRASKLFRSTDGLKVTVARLDPVTRQPVRYEFTDANRPIGTELDFWVRNGDVIEVR